MEESKSPDIRYTVDLSARCEKVYKKLVKRCDPKLLEQINEVINSLETNPGLGEELTQDLKGMRSVHLNQFHYRIVYEVERDNSHARVTVHAIAHRKEAYDKLTKYLGRGD